MKRIFSTLLPLVAALALPVADSSAAEILYARYPALSPDNSTIAFSYRGDLWTVPSEGGQATRLTVHDAEDIRPFFSPDGSTILFTSNRAKNWDVFIMPADGGVPRQLTYHSLSDYGSGWTPEGDSVLFASSRDGFYDIFKVPVAGGMPVRLIGSYREQEHNARITPDGRYLMFNTGSGLSRWHRRDLRTGGNADIYLLDRRSRELEVLRLTDYVHHDVWPIYNAETGEVYFVSNRDEWGQIWKVPATGGDATRLTHFTDDGVQWLNSNPQGTMLVFEQNFRIWIGDPSGGEPRQVPIHITTDERDNLIEKKVLKGEVQWFALSPDEKKLAAVIHGEIFVLPAEDPKEAKRITFTSARERTPLWGKDSRTIFYASDRHDNYDIYSADVLTGVETRLTEDAADETRPVPSPDGEYLAFYRGLDNIIRYDLESGRESVWVSGTFVDMALEPTMEFSWSPDSKWLAFAMCGPTFESDIYAIDLDGEMHNVSRFHGFNHRPRFSADGKLVYFSSWTRQGENTYKVDLVHKPAEFVEASFDSLFVSPEDEESDDKDKEDKDGDKEADDAVKVMIDPDRIELRRSLPFRLDASVNYPVLTPDGEKYVFVSAILGKPEIWSVNAEDDPNLEQLTHSGGGKAFLTVTNDSKSVYYLEGGRIKKSAIAGGKSSTLSFTASMEVDVMANNRQKFRETWQMFNSYFYDPTFRGLDWESVRAKYAPLVDYVRTEEEFRNIVFELMGELNASHIYIYPRPSRPEAPVLTGETGIELDYDLIDREGVFRISGVIPESPADLAEVKAGQYLQRVNDTELSREVNYYRLMAGTRDKRVTLAVSDSPRGEADEVVLKPFSDGRLRSTIYERWVRRNRRVVDSVSGGRLAYIHVPAMNMASQKRFEEQLVSLAETKEGLVLDVRDNGGGWTAVNVLGTLVKSPYVLRAFRGAEPTSENKMRSKAYERPLTLLINNYSFSNAEIFAEGFRKLGLGKIVGTPTGSGVIGTASYDLIDGTRVRRPSTGAFTTEMEDTDLEPRQPDILVELLPQDYLSGVDPQLIRAAEELLGELP
jgi:Tol biopolymer transport system component